MSETRTRESSIQYRKSKMPATRLVGIDMVELGRRCHYVHGLIEPDVTGARAAIKRLRDSGTRISFTGWIAKCLADAAAESGDINVLRKGRSLYAFEAVHVAMPIEATFEGKPVPLPYLVRDCESKTVLDITGEIDLLKSAGPSHEMVLADRKAARMAKVSILLPSVARRFAMKLMLRDPVRVHDMMGALCVTAVGMFGASGGWPIVIPTGHALVIAVGGIAQKPVLMDDSAAAEPRELLNLTMSFDHDVIDGAPAARFTARLIEMLEAGHGLDFL
jgi:pyruvate/2-oxoglutarate dehydrogenase complex dihydrolipoamide acyltransferase (E2) component